MEVHFHVPYNARYGIINVEYLSRIDRIGLMSYIHCLVEGSIEVRGDPKAQGVYISSDYLLVLASTSELRYDQRALISYLCQKRSPPCSKFVRAL